MKDDALNRDISQYVEEFSIPGKHEKKKDSSFLFSFFFLRSTSEQ